MKLRKMLIAGVCVVVGHRAAAQDSTRAIAAPPLRTFAALLTTGPAWDTTKPANEQAHFKLHSANLTRLRAANAIVVGGRFGEYGLILLRAPSLDSARAMFVPDSMIVKNVFKLALTPWSTIYDGTITRP